MRPVNLLPRDETRRSARSTTVAGVTVVPAASPLALAALAALVLIGVLLGFAAVRERNKVESRREALAAVQKELAATPAPVQNGADAAAARLTAFSTAAAARIAWDAVLRDVSRVLPEDAWLESLAARAPAASGAAAATPGAVPTAFTATGYTYTQKAVARLLTRLALVPALTNVQLQSSVATKLGERRLVKFTVLADIDAAEAAS